MRQSFAVGSGAALTIVATHGTVSSGMNLRTPQPVWSYEGFFRQAILWMSRLWNHAHGWETPSDLSALDHLSNIEDFARFLAHAVFLLFPLLGFLTFTLASRSRFTWQWWKPLAIAVAFTTPLQSAIHGPLRLAGLSEPLAEALRAGFVFTLMLWSIGAIHPSNRLAHPRVAHSAAGSLQLTNEIPGLLHRIRNKRRS